MATAESLSLAAGDLVHLKLPYVDALPARVERTSGSAVTVTLAVPDPRVPRLKGRPAWLERTSSRGVHRFSGAMLDVAGEFLTIVVTGEAERLQRRAWARVDAVLPVRVEPLERSAWGGDTTTLNLSVGGLLIIDPWRLAVGTDVRMALSLGDDAEPLRALCRVVRDAGNGRTALKVADLAREDQDRLMRFVRVRERAELRVSRGAA